MKIKLWAEEGMEKSRIAEHLGVSRQTVYNHLNRTEPFPKPRPKRASKLDPFKAYIRGRLERFDLPSTVLLRELRAQGYDGGITILREFVRPLKAEHTRRVTERFETVPGQQAQMDWGECGTITVDGERRKLYLFVLVLGYSRMTYARFTTSTRLPVLLECLQAAFRSLGIPAELLVDNMKQAVDEHDPSTGRVRWNGQFLDFVEHFGTVPVASPPYWPRVKGKVERGVGYIKASFLEGRSFADLEDLNRQLEAWLEAVANARVHGTTGERPCDRHQKELPRLRPAGAVPAYDTRPIEVRKVAADAHFSFEGVRYSVPPRAAGHTVTVRPSGTRIGDGLEVYLGGELVAEHRRARPGTGRVTLAEHAAEIRRIRRERGGPGQRPRGPRFHQRAEDPSLALHTIREEAPVVQVGSLATYEALAGEVAQ